MSYTVNCRGVYYTTLCLRGTFCFLRMWPCWGLSASYYWHGRWSCYGQFRILLLCPFVVHNMTSVEHCLFHLFASRCETFCAFWKLGMFEISHCYFYCSCSFCIGQATPCHNSHPSQSWLFVFLCWTTKQRNLLPFKWIPLLFGFIPTSQDLLWSFWCFVCPPSANIMTTHPCDMEWTRRPTGAELCGMKWTRQSTVALRMLARVWRRRIAWRRSVA